MPNLLSLRKLISFTPNLIIPEYDDINDKKLSKSPTISQIKEVSDNNKIKSEINNFF